MFNVHPDWRQFYVVNDNILTGENTAKELEKVTPRFPGVEAELHHYATTDDMTGVCNRRTGLVMLEKQLANAARRGSNLCVCFVDENNLKQVNDNFGHDKGDEIILALCDLLTVEIRSSDMPVQTGRG